jgi:hypothetical protein
MGRGFAVDAHVPQRKGVVRLSHAALLRRWPGLILAIAWALLLACVPWWIGVPLLLALAIVQLARVPRLRAYNEPMRRALRWGLVGVLIAAYRAFGGHALGLTYTLLAALVGFSLLVLLESWQQRKPLRNAAIAAESPEWHEMALAPVGPAAVIIDIEPATWNTSVEFSGDATFHVERIDDDRYRIGERIDISQVEPHMSLSKGQRWAAWPMVAGRGLVLYDRAREKVFRLRGWKLFGWHGDEAWLTRSDDQPPVALSHVLGQDYIDE